MSTRVQRRDVTTFVARFTAEFPVAHGRLFPHLTGGGVDRVAKRCRVVVEPIPWMPLKPPGTQPVDHVPNSTNTVHSVET